MSLSNTTPLPSDIPENGLHGSADEYLRSLEPEFRRPMCILMMRMLAAERMANLQNGEALKALASLESKVVIHLKSSTPAVNVEWVKPK
jgi:hypothetical protein